MRMCDKNYFRTVVQRKKKNKERKVKKNGFNLTFNRKKQAPIITKGSYSLSRQRPIDIEVICCVLTSQQPEMTRTKKLAAKREECMTLVIGKPSPATGALRAT